MGGLTILSIMWNKRDRLDELHPPFTVSRRLFVFDVSMSLYRLLADGILAIHFAYVAFVVLGMAAILVGLVLHWDWVRNFWFRAVHLLLIAVVVFESVFGILCPLTEWENRLRELAGEDSAPGTFVARWMDRWLFVDLAPSTLLACYCLFGALVLATWFFAPPRWPKRFPKNRDVS